ncbi:MAG: hypothetical protein QF704_11160 [Anaerolineales bacterium]|nr:hypothetical protein [Anaerolineales bacterium]
MTLGPRTRTYEERESHIESRLVNELDEKVKKMEILLAQKDTKIMKLEQELKDTIYMHTRVEEQSQ